MAELDDAPYDLGALLEGFCPLHRTRLRIADGAGWCDQCAIEEGLPGVGYRVPAQAGPTPQDYLLVRLPEGVIEVPRG